MKLQAQNWDMTSLGLISVRRTVSCVISSCNGEKNAVRGSTTISGGFSVLSVDGKLRKIKRKIVGNVLIVLVVLKQR